MAPEPNNSRAIDYRLRGTTAYRLLRIDHRDVLGFDVQNDTPAVDRAYRSKPLPVPHVVD